MARPRRIDRLVVKRAQLTAASSTSVGKTATFQILNDFVPGEWVDIRGVTDSGISANAYVGRSKITAATNSQFSYEMVDGQTITSPPSGVPTFARVWWTKRLLVERNTFNIGLGSVGGPPSAVYIQDRDVDSQRKSEVCHEAIVRENIIQIADDAPAPTAEAVVMQSVGNAMLVDNVITLTKTDPLHDYFCGSILYSNNRKHSGELIQGRICSTFSCASSGLRDEIATAVEDAQALNFL